MLKLMKYEMRKSRFSKLMILTVLGIFELVFLYGVFFTKMEQNPTTGIGVTGLVVCTIIGISFIGIESLLALHKDLNTKQSYMLFMTPRTGFQILGAKILENALSIFFTSVLFLLLAYADISLLLGKLGSIKDLILAAQDYMGIELDWMEFARSAVMAFGEGVISWFHAIVTGYLAIILSSSVLAGKKLNGVVSFVLFIVFLILQERVLVLVLKLFKVTSIYGQQFIIYAAVNLIFGILIYIGSCMMLEKKLSV